MRNWKARTGLQSWEAVSQAQARIRRSCHQEQTGEAYGAAASHRRRRLAGETSLVRKKSAAPGVDDVTWTEYAENLESRPSQTSIVGFTQEAYRARPSAPEVHTQGRWRIQPAARDRRVRGQGRPGSGGRDPDARSTKRSSGLHLWVPVAGRNQHQALDALGVRELGSGGSTGSSMPISRRSSSRSKSRNWLIRFVEDRIGDRRVVDSIRQVVGSRGSSKIGQLIETE